MGLSMFEWMFYGGIVVCVGAVLLGLVAAVVLHVWKVRLQAKLTDEFGDKRI